MPKVQMQISGQRQLMAQLTSLRKESQSSTGNAQVKYLARYSLHVHERTDIPHSNGQAKYLSTPAKQRRAEMQDIVRTEMKKGRTVLQAVTKAALYLLRESQKLVPVRTGFLKRSGRVIVSKRYLK